jgi:uncharacterized membrane protein
MINQTAPLHATALLASAFALCGTGIAQDQAALITFDVPNAMATYPMKVNNFGEVAGYYVDTNAVFHGFERFSTGDYYAPVNAPHADDTLVLALNDNQRLGVLGGRFLVNGSIHGFRTKYNPLQFIQYDVPGALSTEIYAINNHGLMAGSFENANGTFGFVDDGGRVIPFQVNGKTTFARSMNNQGDIVGTYGNDVVHAPHAYLRKSGGSVITLGPPGAAWTEANSINDPGVVAGTALGSDGSIHGFKGLPGKLLKFYDYPGAVETHLTGINNAGSLTGYYVDSNGHTHGFLLTKN